MNFINAISVTYYYEQLLIGLFLGEISIWFIDRICFQLHSQKLLSLIEAGWRIISRENVIR